MHIGLQEETLNRIDSEKMRNVASNTLKTARQASLELLRSSRFRHSMKDFIQLGTEILKEDETFERGTPQKETRREDTTKKEAKREDTTKPGNSTPN